MAVVARIAQPDGKTVLRLALSSKQAVRTKGLRSAKVELIDEETQRVIPDVSVRRDGDTIELSVLRNGEKQVLILEDGDGAGISVSTETGQVIGGDSSVGASTGASTTPGAAGTQSSVWPGTFIVGDDIAAAAIPWLWPAALIGGAALLLHRDPEPDRTPPVVSGLDITTATDTGADDLTTGSGAPSLTFSGEPGLKIALKGADGTLLDKSQYTVNYAAGRYTVTLVDANTGIDGAQAFGSFLNGVATGNAASAADGVYTIVATDSASNSADVGTFTIDTTSPSTGALDITEATDTGPNDTRTSHGLPILTFSGEPGLNITLKGVDGSLLDPMQYSVSYVPGAGAAEGTYTVALIDADTGTAGAQGFGSFTNGGVASNNPAASLDGTYTVVATDSAENSKDVGTFAIDTTPPTTGALDINAATDTGADDSNTRNGLPVLNFTGEAGLAIVLNGVNGAALNPSQYSVVFNDGTYTVALLDADLTNAGVQGFGSYTETGAPSGNPAASADGRYTIVATDTAANAKDVGSFVIDTTPPITGPLDISAATDTGADDTNTRSGLPELTFSGEPGLNVMLRGADGALLDASQYTVNYANGLYTVTLVDANLGTAGAQNFGSFDGSGAATGNPAGSADGTYTIVVTDTAANAKDVGSFVIDTTPPVTGALDITTATDTGANDTNTGNSLPILTFSGEPGLAITLKGADGSLLAPSQYSVSYAPGAGGANGTYVVALLDANTGAGGAQGFGNFTSAGAASGNPASSVDGTYTIVATDSATNSKDVGTFTIDTTAPAAPTVTDVTENAGDPNAADLITNDNTQVLSV
ncbi:MAG: hypothetical protein RL322_3100, partial [Pseudomonadota bacterium]